ncbi:MULTISPECIES: hypothetical protein [Bacillus]|nr:MULTISPECIES: hypothetical protein [Bacillus]MDY7903235.1 hypothetical protein [Bacillus sp. AG1]NRS33170.1 hypothetical protein [Bacillus velezensis]NRS42963.1 hypothetical protein [Bacillus velezensis]ODB75552.1 hypothetical protein A7310_15110 [Bacillus velezensis]QWK26467.1 hypothetical protein KM776_06595 [Bacillus velezensis]
MKGFFVGFWRRVYKRKKNEVEKIPFDEITEVTKYLEYFGTPYKKGSTIKHEEDFKKKLKQEKLKENQLNKLIKKLDGSLEVSNDTSNLTPIPFAINTAVMTSTVSIITSLIAFYAATANSFSKIALDIDEKKTIKPSELLQMIIDGGLHLSSVAVFCAIILYFIIMGIWHRITKKRTEFSSKLRCYKMLLEEIIEEKSETEEKKNGQTEDIKQAKQTKKNRKKRNKK